MEYFKLDVSPRIISSPRAASHSGRLSAQLDAAESLLHALIHRTRSPLGGGRMGIEGFRSFICKSEGYMHNKLGENLFKMNFMSRIECVCVCFLCKCVLSVITLVYELC